MRLFGEFSNTVTLRRIASLIKLILMGSSGFLCCMKCGTRHSGKCNIRKSSRRISDLEWNRIEHKKLSFTTRAFRFSSSRKSQSENLCRFNFRSLVKRVNVGMSVQPIEDETVEEIMVQGGAVSPIVTIEPRRRKFHKAITVTMPLPERMSAQYLRRKQENLNTNTSLKKDPSKNPIGKHNLVWSI